MRLHIAHVIEGLGIGGAERNLVNLLNALAPAQRTLYCIGAPNPDGDFFESLDDRVRVVRIRIRRRTLFQGVARLARSLKESKVDIVHTHMYWSSLVGALAARVARVPGFVTTEHGENPWKNSMHRTIERYLISSRADWRLCVSPQILAIRRDLDRIPSSKLMLMPNGTTIPDSSAEQATQAQTIIGAVGRFIEAKNFCGLIDAFSLVRNELPDCQLVILGDGPLRHQLETRIAEHGLQASVKLPGLVSDTGHWYRQFSVYVSSSIREGLPIALLEAMSYGLPVVATDVGAAAETVIDGKSGLIVPPSDPGALAQSLVLVLKNAELRRELGDSARRRVECEFSVSKIAADHVELYRRILDSKVADAVPQ